MYKTNLLLFLILILTSISMEAFAGRRAIMIKGLWSNKILRSSISTEPVVTLDDTTLEIYFPTALDDVLIRVQDEQGNSVFEESISVGAMETYSVDLFDKGEYSLEIYHFDKGELVGQFIVE